MEDERETIRGRDRVERGDDRRGTQRQHVEVTTGKEIDRVELGDGKVAFPHLLQQREMVVHGIERLGRHTPVVVELTARSQIEHGANAEGGNSREVGALDAMDAIGAIQQAPTHRPTVGGGVATEVAEVEGSLERDPAGAGLRLQFHMCKVTGG